MVRLMYVNFFSKVTRCLLDQSRSHSYLENTLLKPVLDEEGYSETKRYSLCNITGSSECDKEYYAKIHRAVRDGVFSDTES